MNTREAAIISETQLEPYKVTAVLMDDVIDHEDYYIMRLKFVDDPDFDPRKTFLLLLPILYSEEVEKIKTQGKAAIICSKDTNIINGNKILSMAHVKIFVIRADEYKKGTGVDPTVRKKD